MPVKLSVIAKRHAYSNYAFIRVCPRHGSISQEDSLAKAHRFDDVDAAVEFLSLRRERLDRFRFFYVNELCEIVEEAFKSDYSI
jgi:hypothetical protein